jgi:hypothetical protein
MLMTGKVVLDNEEFRVFVIRQVNEVPIGYVLGASLGADLPLIVQVDPVLAEECSLYSAHSLLQGSLILEGQMEVSFF